VRVWAAQHSKRSDVRWNLREQLKKQEEEKQKRPLALLLPFGLRRRMNGQMFKGQRPKGVSRMGEGRSLALIRIFFMVGMNDQSEGNG
jgi:hypothetical protein